MVANHNDNLTPEQWERMALWLDGQDVKLTPRELGEAQAMRQAEAHFASQVDVAVPPRAMARAQRNAVVALRQASLARWRWAGSMVAAAAALVLIAVSVLMDAPAPLTPAPVSAQPTIDLAILYTPTPDVELDLLDRQVQECRSQILARPSLDDLQIDAIEKHLVEKIFQQDPMEF